MCSSYSRGCTVIVQGEHLNMFMYIHKNTHCGFLPPGAFIAVQTSTFRLRTRSPLLATEASLWAIDRSCNLIQFTVTRQEYRDQFSRFQSPLFLWPHISDLNPVGTHWRDGRTVYVLYECVCVCVRVGWPGCQRGGSVLLLCIQILRVAHSVTH